jgi:hypothetical protein
VGELDANGSAINAAGFLRELAFNLQLGMLNWLQEAQGIKVGFEISPLAEKIEDSFALAIGRFHECSVG